MYSFSCFTFHVLIVEFIRLFIHADPMFLDRYVQSFINRSKNGKISTLHHNKKKKKEKRTSIWKFKNTFIAYIMEQFWYKIRFFIELYLDIYI